MLTVLNTDYVEAQKRVLPGPTTTTTDATPTTKHPTTGNNDNKIVIAVLSVAVICVALLALKHMGGRTWVVWKCRQICGRVFGEVFYVILTI